MQSFDVVRLFVVSSSDTTRAAVRVCCLPPNELEFADLSDFVNSDHVISDRGEALLKGALAADALLVEWSMEQAPVINLISHEVRRRAGAAELVIPIIALCVGAPEDEIAARAAGADEAMGFPLYMPFIQACVASHTREIKAVRRAAARKLIDSIALHRDSVLERAGEKVGDLTETLLEEAQGGGHSKVDAATIETDVAIRTNEFAEAVIEDLAAPILDGLEEKIEVLDPETDVVRVGDLRLDGSAYRVHVRGHEVALTPKEFDLLHYLMQHVDRVCSRDEILDAVWGIDFETGTNMVEVYMHFLRKKLQAYGVDGMIQTVRARGYRLSAADAA